MKCLGVIGAGQMGTGIAITAANKLRIPVVLYDFNESQIEQQKHFSRKLLEKDEAKGKVNSAKEVLELLRYSNKLSDLNVTSVVVEAVKEDFETKLKVLKEVEKVCGDKLDFLATNTSSISITKLAAGLKTPSNFLGMHFMNPVPVMKLVEIIPGLQTNPQAMDKTTVESLDRPGFIANRLLMPYINEAFFALEASIARSPQDIDTVMQLGTNVPMGPLKLADFIGLDTCLAIMKVLWEGLGEDKYRPAPLLQKYVEAGWLGKKTGKGVYTYTE